MKTRLPQVTPSLTGIKVHLVDGLTAIGQEGFELAAGLLVMIMVERSYGPAGLGIFAYLMACMFGIRFISTMGVIRYVEVETARLENDQNRNAVFAEGGRTIFRLAVGTALLLLLTAAFGAAGTRIEERLGAYVLLALILPVANLNSLKLGMLNGLGRHALVARLRILRYGLILVFLFFLTGTGLAPSLLLIGYLLAEIVLAWRLRRHCRLPKLRKPDGATSTTKQTLARSSPYLLTGNGLDLLLNIDLFVLGLFVGAGKLGIYAEAAVLVRCSLIFAIALRPILRRHYIRRVSIKPTALPNTFTRHTATIFFLQSSVALITLLYYPQVINAIFDNYRETPQSLEIFMLFVPGLIFYSTFLATEPVYEALQQPEDLRQLTFTVTILNLVLTWILVPAAGITGAATATMITMLAHFFLFGRNLPLWPEPGKTVFLAGGMALYLVYRLFSSLTWHPNVYFWLAPLLLLAACYGCGMFGVSTGSGRKQAEEPVIFQLADENNTDHS